MNVWRIAVSGCWTGCFAGCFATMLLLPSPARALSVSVADLFFPSYGQARHMDQSNEYLGHVGNVYDGVIAGPLNRGTTAVIDFYPTVGTLFGTGDYEYLSLWVDWNRNRTWDVSEEVVDIDDQWFDQGTNLLALNITVPQSALIGDTWMRARFSFDGDIIPAGDLQTGEVEDYLVSVGQVTTVPEPGVGALMLLVIGLCPLVARQRGGRR